MTRALSYVALALLGTFFALIYTVAIKPPSLPHGAIEGQELQRTKKLMKKHGVNVLHEKWDGTLWFKRDGRMVKA